MAFIVFAGSLLLGGCSWEAAAPAKPQSEKPSADTSASTLPQGTNTSNSSSENLLLVMENAVLQYPSRNDEWEYNVYDCYIELTDYIGPETAALSVPGEIEGLLVWSLNTGRIFDNNIRGEYNDILTSVEFPDGLRVIGDETFLWCRELNSFSLPNTLLIIGKDAFADCSMASLTIPHGVKVIEEGAFDGASFTTSTAQHIIIPSSVEEIGRVAFRGVGYQYQSPSGTNYYPDGYEITIENPDTQLGESCFEAADVIYGHAGSTAAQYCAEYDMVFQLLE